MQLENLLSSFHVRIRHLYEPVESSRSKQSLYTYDEYKPLFGSVICMYVCMMYVCEFMSLLNLPGQSKARMHARKEKHCTSLVQLHDMYVCVHVCVSNLKPADRTNACVHGFLVCIHARMHSCTFTSVAETCKFVQLLLAGTHV